MRSHLRSQMLNAIHGGVRDEFNLRSRLYLFAFTDFDEDALQNLNLSQCARWRSGISLDQKQKYSVRRLCWRQLRPGIFFFLHDRKSCSSAGTDTGLESQSRRSAEIVTGESLKHQAGIANDGEGEQLSFFRM